VAQCPIAGDANVNEVRFSVVVWWALNCFHSAARVLSVSEPSLVHDVLCAA